MPALHLDRTPLVTLCLVLAAVATSALLGHALIDQPLTGSDDANIFFVYANNWLEGHGLAYNAGGERVEGFSSPLFLLIATTCFAFAPWPELAIACLNALLVALALTGLVRFLERTAGHSAGWLTLGWTLSWPAFTGWTVLCLMDSGVWTALIVAATTLALRCVAGEPTAVRTRSWIAIGMLLPLTRPEGMGWGIVFPAVLLVSARSGLAPAGARRAALAALCATAGTTAALVTARLAYFGHPLPNPYYAKVSPDVLYGLSTGLRYALDFIEASPLVALWLGAALAGTIQALRTRPQREPASRDAALVVASATLLAVGLAIPIAEGGDHHGLFRAYQPIWPLLPVPAWFGLALLRARSDERRTRIEFSFAAMLALLALFYAAQRHPWHDHVNDAIAGEIRHGGSERARGDHLNRVFADVAPPSIGVNLAGGVAYRYRGEVFDLLGLNDVRMAHAPGDRRGVRDHAAFDAQVFWTHPPDWMLPSIAGSDFELPCFQPVPGSFTDIVLSGLIRDDVFRSRYVPGSGRRPGGPEVYGFIERGAFERLQRSGLVMLRVPWKQLDRACGLQR